MLDLLYLFGTAAFFAVMLGYVRACDALGRRAETEGPPDDR